MAPPLQPRSLPGNAALAVLIPTATWLIFRPFIDPVPRLPVLYTSLGFSIIAFLSTLYLVPVLGASFIKAGLKGKDLLKVYKDDM